MPELPEVEQRRRYIEAHALNQPIAGVKVLDAGVLEKTKARALQAACKGRRFVGSHRHGKFLFMTLDSGADVLWHFGMTGNPAYLAPKEAEPRFVRVRFDMESGHRLAFDCMRKIGRIGLIRDREAYIAAKKLGPDPTHDGFDYDTFAAALANRTGLLKPVLLNQSVIAGIGNLYADEMLYQNGLHPETRTADLKPKTLRGLHESMQDVLRLSIKLETDFERFPQRYLLAHRFYDATCPRCGADFATLRVGGRTTYYCKRHQRRRS